MIRNKQNRNNGAYNKVFMKIIGVVCESTPVFVREWVASCH